MTSPSCLSDSLAAGGGAPAGGNSHPVARQQPSNHMSCYLSSWDMGPPTDLRQVRQGQVRQVWTETGSVQLQDIKPGTCPELQVWSGPWDGMWGWRPQGRPGWTRRPQSWNEDRTETHLNEFPRMHCVQKEMKLCEVLEDREDGDSESPLIRPLPTLAGGQRSDNPAQLGSGAPWEPACLARTSEHSSSSAAFGAAAPHSARRRRSSQQSETRKLNRDFPVRTWAPSTRAQTLWGH